MGKWEYHFLGGGQKHFLSQDNLLNSVHSSLSGWFE